MALFKYDKSENNDTFALGCFGIVLLMLSPMIVGNIGVHLAKSNGQPCGETIWIVFGHSFQVSQITPFHSVACYCCYTYQCG